VEQFIFVAEYQVESVVVILAVFNSLPVGFLFFFRRCEKPVEDDLASTCFDWVFRSKAVVPPDDSAE
jgi:hypothetical protein